MLLNVKQAAERLGVCASLVYGWCQAGQLVHFRVGARGKRGGIRIDEADLTAFMRTLRCGGETSMPSPAPRSRRVILQNLKLS
jgi:excisionase family DNA binding protein